MANVGEWRSRVRKILDDYERGVVKGTLSQSDLAKLAGVSRQTIWRDSELMSRYRAIHTVRLRSNGIGIGRPTSEMRIRLLEQEIAKIKRENDFLVQNIVLICRRLREKNLDPSMFVAEASDDVRHASTRLLGS